MKVLRLADAALLCTAEKEMSRAVSFGATPAPCRLAIPLPVAGKGQRGGRITPGEWESRTGKRLRFIYRPGKSALLVMDEGRINARGLAKVKGGKRRRDGIKTGEQTIPIFVLVPQVKLRKRLRLQEAATYAASAVPGSIVANWRSM